MLNELIEQLKQIEDQETLCKELETFILNFKEKNMRGFVYIIYIGNNLYKIGSTADLEQRLKQLGETRVVQIIKAENMTNFETQLHKKFSSKRVFMSQELFKLNDQDLLYIHELQDEWEDNQQRIF